MKRPKRTEKTGAPPQASGSPRAYRAGCGRTWTLASREPDLAYTELEHAECSTCLHRVEPDETRPFCTLRPEGARHPFADLAHLELAD